jgi:hypothetical protein
MPEGLLWGAHTLCFGGRVSVKNSKEKVGGVIMTQELRYDGYTDIDKVSDA